MLINTKSYMRNTESGVCMAADVLEHLSLFNYPGICIGGHILPLTSEHCTNQFNPHERQRS
jgi:hypothetical protein